MCPRPVSYTHLDVYKRQLLFYAWGEPVYLLLMVAVAGANWAFGRLLGKQPERKFLALAVTFNLLCLGVFKYTGFLLENVYALAHIERAAPQIALPIGISFYKMCIRDRAGTEKGRGQARGH